jgi:hypothetical protein
VKTVLIATGSALLGAGALLGAAYWYFRDAFR